MTGLDTKYDPRATCEDCEGRGGYSCWPVDTVIIGGETVNRHQISRALSVLEGEGQVLVALGPEKWRKYNGVMLRQSQRPVWFIAEEWRFVVQPYRAREPGPKLELEVTIV